MNVVRSGLEGFRRRAGRVSSGYLAAGIVLALVVTGCRTTAPSGPGPGGVELEGMASWYGPEFAGRPTANGEIFDPQTMTAAHRTLPFGTILDVTNLKNGLTTRVRINDRGPFVGNRIIDLSYAAARSIEMVEDGVSRVRLDVVRLGRGDREPPEPYSVTIASEPTEAVPELSERSPHPEPVQMIEDEPPAPVSVPEPIVSEAIPETPPASAAGWSPPTATAAEPPPSTPPARVSPDRGWKVQLGAFGVEDNARRLARELSGQVSGVYVENVGGLFRVRVGVFGSKAEAIDMAERVHALGYDAIVLSPDAR